MRISPHLCFDGQCREAMHVYQSILGGTLQTMLTYGETPMAALMDSRCNDRIVHATLVVRRSTPMVVRLSSNKSFERTRER
jgi:PhnB protein